MTERLEGEASPPEQETFAHLREVPIEVFLAEAAATLIDRPLSRRSGNPVRWEDLLPVIDEDRRLDESVSAEYVGATGEVRLSYSWSAKGTGRNSYGSTEARAGEAGAGVVWTTRLNDGTRERALPETITPSDIHQAYFRDVVIRALTKYKQEKDSLAKRVSRPRRPVKTVISDLL